MAGSCQSVPLSNSTTQISCERGLFREERGGPGEGVEAGEWVCRHADRWEQSHERGEREGVGEESYMENLVAK